jgi:hypothetical protein
MVHQRLGELMVGASEYQASKSSTLSRLFAGIPPSSDNSIRIRSTALLTDM